MAKRSPEKSEDPALEALRAQLGPSLPPGLGALDTEDVERLVAAIDGARRRQVAEQLRSRDEALRVLPWPLRGVVKKVLGA